MLGERSNMIMYVMHVGISACIYIYVYVYVYVHVHVNVYIYPFYLVEVF